MHWFRQQFSRVLFTGFISILVLASPLAVAFAAVWVDGYTRKDGTPVKGHYRSNPDGNPYNNWSYPGNTNPYTGETATGNPDTYLNNYYGGSGSSYGSSSGSDYTATPFRYVEGGYYYGASLFCNSGYYQSSESCRKAPANATAYGGTTFYCNTGYYRVGEECPKLPDHAYSFFGESWKCYSGYIKQGDQCIKPVNGQAIAGILYCDSGYVARNDQCVSHTEDCRLSFGDHVSGKARLLGGSSCSCETGYTWNSSNTYCVQSQVAAAAHGSGQTYSIEELQRQIQALLMTIASLQQQLANLAAQ